MSENWRQSEICIAINEKSRASIAKHLSYDGLFHYYVLLHICLSSVCCHLMQTVIFCMCICMLVQSISVSSLAVFLRALLSETRSSAITEGPRDASCQLKSCQLPRNSAETTSTTSPDQIDGMKLEI